MNANRWIALAALLGGLAVVAGSFGAHGLKERLSPEMLANWETAAKYQMYHSLALLGVVLWRLRFSDGDRTLSRVIEWSFLVGIVLFSGSLYLYALTDYRKLGMVAPIGGTAFILGWVLWSIAAWRQK